MIGKRIRPYGLAMAGAVARTVAAGSAAFRRALAYGAKRAKYARDRRLLTAASDALLRDMGIRREDIARFTDPSQSGGH